ncbi:MAG: helix-turn-helix domain-containing protein [Thermoanaerobaculia bacterium]
MRKRPQPKFLLNMAAVASLRRIDEDGKNAPEDIAAVLRQIRRELFRKDLTVGRLRQELSLAANDTTTRFRRHTGAGIRRYVEDRRLECARRLILDSDLGFAEIAGLVGFHRYRTFREAFQRRLGCRLKVYRETRRPRLPELPRFVAGVAPLSSETRRAPSRCGRCRAGLEAGTRVRVFEDLAMLCDPCARRHAPPAIAAALDADEAQPGGLAQALRGVFGLRLVT